jgi:hypothetical protein
MTIGAQILEYSRLTCLGRPNEALECGNGVAGSIEIPPAMINRRRKRQKSASA